LVPQVVEAWVTQAPAGSALPAATLVQAPVVPDSAHDLHEAVQALLQQTPCAQKPLWHSTAVEQEAPFSFLPQELVLHTLGVKHWELVVHTVKQVLPLQTYGLQGRESGVTQAPAPSQVEACVSTLDVQLSALHTDPAAYFWQAPLPSHLPLVPQEATPMSVHMRRGSLLPPGVMVQVPGAEARAQLRQAPVQALLQQTPSTQKPERHSPAPPQVWPGSLGPQLPFTQARPVSQSALVVQRELHAPPTQANGVHGCTPGGRQVPRPSQVPAVLSRFPVQDGATHWVSAGYLAHPPTPSHLPVVPQLGAP
jgi:hypothetical protein